VSKVTLRLATLLILAVVCASPSRIQAHITRVEITRTESPTFEGGSFGSVGKYEKLVGRAYGEVDPSDPRNALITDIKLAPRNAKGLVEYSTDIFILKPIDPSKGNHRLFFEINNRGTIATLRQYNDAKSRGTDPSTAADAGNGFLMRQGYTIIWCGWDPTVDPGDGRFTITVPIAKNPDGSAIVGPALEEFVIDDAKTMKGKLTYPAATLDKSQANLTVRVRYEDKPVTVPASGWEYIDAGAVRLLPAGTPFRQGSLYEFTYRATNPIVAGLGFASIRDVAAFLRNASRGDHNPIPAGDLQLAYSACVSQPCRTMHDFLRLGFNEDESGRRVFDGILNWVGGGSGIFLNYRFAQPDRTQRQHIARWYPEYQFPFTNGVIQDPVTGKTDGWLRRCLASNTCPKVFEVNSENEYWAKALSAFQLDGSGKDLPDPPNVRTYLLSSLPHGAAKGPGICQQPRNPLEPNPILRGLLVALDEWVTKEKSPPESRMPRRADGTLVPPLPQAGMGFPDIPGVKYNGRNHTGDRYDFGPQADQGILTILPPTLLGTPYPSLVPKTDIDGNDIAGIRLPEVAVPLATYTGWGLRANAGDDGCDGAGQMIEFAQTKVARQASGDPRLSIEERYPTHGDYVSRIDQVANDLYRERLLLDEDVKRYADLAAKSNTGSGN
jgi:hypothetical protein